MQKQLSIVACFALACSGSSAPSIAITGEQGFVVGSSMLDSREAATACGANAVGGGYAALSIQLFESPAATCSNAAKGGRLLDIGITTTEYASGKTGSELTQPVATGTYTIGDEEVPDEDVCMLRNGATAILQIRDVADGGGSATRWNAVSGTVTIDNLTAGSISGSFDVILRDPNGNGTSGGTLHGTFGTEMCPR